MELSVHKTELLRELQLFQGIIERKNTIPILANILIEAEDKGEVIRLTATDLEVGLRSECPATVTTGGSLTLPAKKLFEIVKALPETEVSISESGKDTVRVSAERFNSRMQTLPRDDFPSLPVQEEESGQDLSSSVLREMVGKTQFAITGEDTRYFLNGALFLLTPSLMTLVATDGHRLAMASAPRSGDSSTAGVENADADGAEERIILPKKTLWELARLLQDGDETVVYARGENHLFFNIGRRQLVSRMIDAQFPAHERVIPKGNDKRVEFERDRLTNAIKRVALLSSERSRAVKFQVDTGKVEISSNSPEVGEASEVISVEYEAEAKAICFNAQYVLDFLGVADSESVSLEFKDELSQAVLSPLASGGCDYTYVIMPMRV